MNYTAKQHFSTWHSKAGYHFDNSIKEMRLKSIDSIIESEDEDLWLDIVKIYLGLNIKNITFKAKFIEFFIKVDSTFPLTQNENLLQILAACSLAILFDEKSDLLAYQIALSVTNANFLKKYDLSQFQYVNDFANKNLIEFTITERRESLDEVGNGLSSIEEQLNAEDSDDAATILNSDLRILHDSIKTLSQAYRALSEENNILWWLYGGLSPSTGKQFSENSLQSMIFYAPRELFDLTKFKSGVNKSKEFLHKALLLSNENKSLEVEQNLFDLINREIDSSTFMLLEGYEDLVSIFTPLILAIKSSYTLKGDDWAIHFKGESNQSNIKQNFNPILIAYQLYKELVFLNTLKDGDGERDKEL